MHFEMQSGSKETNVSSFGKTFIRDVIVDVTEQGGRSKHDRSNSRSSLIRRLTDGRDDTIELYLEKCVKRD